MTYKVVRRALCGVAIRHGSVYGGEHTMTQYEEAKLEIVTFDAGDVIATSNPDIEEGGGTIG